MTPVCPRPCGRLATAAILISVGVVQLVAGLILVRSKYVYLLSAPDFWTAATNFAVGGLLGISASVWKDTQKSSRKHTTRRHLLASLVVSSLLMNVTTAAILVLGEGNTLLSIQLENSGLYSNATLASELLAYAYATSVCSPIVCIVVACIFLSGLWFRRTEKNTEPLKIKNVPKEDDDYAYSWVFRPKLHRMPHPDPTLLRRALSTKHLSSSTEDDDDLNSFSDTTLHRSNSLPSVDGSLLNASRRIRARSDSNLIRQLQSRRQTLNDLPRGRNKVSFVDESVRSDRIPRHFENQEHTYQGYHDIEDDIDFESGLPISGRHAYFNLETKRSEDVDVVTDLEYGSQREFSRSQSRPDCESFKAKSLVTVDVHRDGGMYESERSVNYNNSAEESTLVYEADSSSSDVFGKLEDNGFPRAKSKIRRTSTERSLKSLEAIDKRGHETVRRTSTAINSNSPAEFSVQEYDTSDFDQIKASRATSLNDTSYTREIFDDSNIDFIDASFEIPKTKCLAGEVVPIQVSTLPRKLSSKLVPVSIPVVPGTGKYSLKTSDRRYIKSIKESHRQVSSAARKDKFHAKGEPKLLSFRDGTKTDPKESRLDPKENKLSRSKERLIRKQKATSLPKVSSPTNPGPSGSSQEYPCPSSPAHTSGYMSSLEDTLDSSGKSQETSATVSPDTGVSGGQARHAKEGRWDSKHKRHSLEPTSSEEITNQTNYRSLKMPSKKELIDHLLKDPSFHKIMMQSLKETEI